MFGYDEEEDDKQTKACGHCNAKEIWGAVLHEPLCPTWNDGADEEDE